MLQEETRAAVFLLWNVVTVTFQMAGDKLRATLRIAFGGRELLIVVEVPTVD